MAGTVDAAGDPIPTSAVLMASSKHIAFKCQAENVEFIKCKKKDPNPEKCLEKGKQVTRCVLGLVLVADTPTFIFSQVLGTFLRMILSRNLELNLAKTTPAPAEPTTHTLRLKLVNTRLRDLHQRCTKEMDAYVGCMYYNTNEFDLCRKEQQAFEKACPLD
ncbi:hypothetical protein FEM48_Zijuj07G0139700 [Ziziphus jujuba var. spinosa]|uniref:CHCH domain-containing protein n=1 Tax=Ziziphus jujuba var. spinosa TaxID=714518 RepID=A0A978V518_ZIZJJ|nr:hypothetical protein FEM48_Zijuj07G0139700 [Ziziphus jujuba var. spinosa]